MQVPVYFKKIGLVFAVQGRLYFLQNYICYFFITLIDKSRIFYAAKKDRKQCTLFRSPSFKYCRGEQDSEDIPFFP